MSERDITRAIDGVSETIGECLTSEFERGMHGNPATFADVVAAAGERVANALRDLGTGNAASPMGAIELLAKEVRDGSLAISVSLSEIAAAINRHTDES